MYIYIYRYAYIHYMRHGGPATPTAPYHTRAPCSARVRTKRATRARGSVRPAVPICIQQVCLSMPRHREEKQRQQRRTKRPKTCPAQVQSMRFATRLPAFFCSGRISRNPLLPGLLKTTPKLHMIITSTTGPTTLCKTEVILCNPLTAPLALCKTLCSPL